MAAELVPAILTNDISDFRKKYAELFALSQYFSKLHIDFIDGEFVPNPSIQPSDLKFFKSPLILTAHFMAFNPQLYFEQISKIGFKWALIHYEAFRDDQEILEALEKGKKFKLKMGIVVNPETSISKLKGILPKIDLVQVMGVHPGAQGRGFVPSALEKIIELKKMPRNVIISVDGGVKLGLAIKCAQAGADWIVIGSAILNATHPKKAMEDFNKELASL